MGTTSKQLEALAEALKRAARNSAAEQQAKVLRQRSFKASVIEDAHDSPKSIEVVIDRSRRLFR